MESVRRADTERGSAGYRRGVMDIEGECWKQKGSEGYRGGVLDTVGECWIQRGSAGYIEGE